MTQNAFHFTDAQVEQIIEEGMIYMCACPAQVAQSIMVLRQLNNYQQTCLNEVSNDQRVHLRIAQAAMAAHALMEECMEDVLRIEKWDRETLKMPECLRRRQLKEI